MRKILFYVFLISSFSVSAEDWGHRYSTEQANQNITVDVNVSVTVSVEWNQGDWTSSSFGYGLTTDGTNWTWVDCGWFENGNGDNKRCKTTVSVSIPGKYYYAYRFIKGGTTSYQHGSDEWSLNASTLSASSTIIVGEVSKASSAWNSTSTWEDGTVPTSSDNVAIMHNVSISSTDQSAKSIYIYNDKTLTVNATGQLTISNDLTVTSGSKGSGNVLLKSTSSGTGSLIVDGNITNNGAITLERYIKTGTQDLYYQSFACPVSGLSVFTDAGQFAYYEESSNNWITYWADENHNTINGYFDATFKTGRGYSIYYSTAQDNKSFEASGTNTLNNLDLTLNSSTSDPELTFAGTNATYKGSNLVGNPFASAINWNASLGWTRTNIGNTIYIWNGAVQQYGSYTKDAGSGTHDVTNEIPPMQGFWVGATAASPELVIGKATRIHSSQGLLKTQPVNMLKLRVEGANYSDEALINLRADALNGIDEFDASKWFSPSTDVPNLYSIVGEDNLTNNSLLNFENIDFIQLGFQKGIESNYTLSTEYLGSFVNGEVFYLEDTKLGKVVNLNEESSYSFIAEDGDSPLRFKLHLSATAINDPISINKPIISIQNNQLTITNLEPGKVEVKVVDIMGRIVDFRTFNTNSAVSMPLNLKIGIYILEIQTNRFTFTDKVFVR